MNSGNYTSIWQAGDWPTWQFDLAALAQPLSDVSRAQGLLMGRLADVGMALRDQASLSALTEDVIKTSEHKLAQRRQSFTGHVQLMRRSQPRSVAFLR